VHLSILANPPKRNAQQVGGSLFPRLMTSSVAGFQITISLLRFFGLLFAKDLIPVITELLWVRDRAR
jgi:hypothetical protein